MVMTAAMVMMIAMVFVVPMAFMYLPAALIVVIVRMAPVSSRIRWPLPNSRHPNIPSAANSPIAIDPDKTFAGQRWPYFIPNRRRRGADIDLDLAERWNC